MESYLQGTEEFVAFIRLCITVWWCAFCFLEVLLCGPLKVINCFLSMFIHRPLRAGQLFLVELKQRVVIFPEHFATFITFVLSNYKCTKVWWILQSVETWLLSFLTSIQSHQTLDRLKFLHRSLFPVLPNNCTQKNSGSPAHNRHCTFRSEDPYPTTKILLLSCLEKGSLRMESFMR